MKSCGLLQSRYGADTHATPIKIGFYRIQTGIKVDINISVLPKGYKILLSY
jgi:hypothetical protein